MFRAIAWIRLMSVWIDQSNDLQSEREFLGIGRSSPGWLASACACGFHLKVLNPGIGEGILEVAQEVTQVMIICGSPQIEDGSLIRELGEHGDIGSHFPAELGNFNFALSTEAADSLNHPGIHVTGGHAFL